MQLAVVATSLPIELSPIQFVSADDSQICPQGAQRTGNELFAGEHAGHTEKTDKQARDAQEHSDDGAGSYYYVTGRFGAGVFRKFVYQRILRTPACSAKRLLISPGEEVGRIVYCYDSRFISHFEYTGNRLANMIREATKPASKPSDIAISIH